VRKSIKKKERRRRDPNYHLHLLKMATNQEDFDLIASKGLEVLVPKKVD
jgi:hypothetical protein